MLNAFTVDVEDYFHVSAYADRIRRAEWDHWEQRVEIGTRRLLTLLDRYRVRATFFVLGWVAERQPRLVKEIHAAGHEIASHSYDHRLVYDMTPEEFRSDLRHSCDVLEQLIGEPVQGYRAPSFSIVKRSLWALEILAEEGLQFDSSIYPIRHDRYGIPDSPIAPYQPALKNSAPGLWEFPGTVCMTGGLRLPVGGGGYFRFYPYRLTAAMLRRIQREQARPCMFYVHPWELDPEQPVLQGPWLRRWRHRVNLQATEQRLERLLSEFSFGAISDVLQERAVTQTSASLDARDASFCKEESPVLKSMPAASVGQ